VTVVLSGDLLNIEFRDGGETLPWKVTVGEVDWSEPSDRVHRAVNVGKEVFEEVVTFFLDCPDAVPQPPADSEKHGCGGCHLSHARIVSATQTASQNK